ncbi:MAG: hypothetical protein ACRDL1_04225, partial [Solirubrobacterales bacterium]
RFSGESRLVRRSAGSADSARHLTHREHVELAALAHVRDLRGAAYRPRSHPGAPVDLLVYTEREREACRPRFRAEVEHGVVLYRRAA